MWRDGNPRPVFTDTLDLDLTTVEPCCRSQASAGRVVLCWSLCLLNADRRRGRRQGTKNSPIKGIDHESNMGQRCGHRRNHQLHQHLEPEVLSRRGWWRGKPREKGLKTKPWVKTSLAPGSQVVTDYLLKADLQKDLDAQGFNLVGYGCTTCIGNSGPLKDPIEAAIKEGDLTVAGVLSGNRNFEGRIHPLVKSNYLASPPLVVAYALAGSVKIDLSKEPLGTVRTASLSS